MNEEFKIQLKTHKKTICLVHPTIGPYRHLLFEKLSETIELMVYYCSGQTNKRQWDLWPRAYNYKYKILPRIAIKIHHEEFSLNPSIIEEIIKTKPHRVIICGYTDPTMWLAFIISRFLKIPIIYWTEGIKEPLSILGLITRPVRLFFLKNSTSILVPGKISKKYVTNFGVEPNKVVVAPNAIDNEFFFKIMDKNQQYKEHFKRQLKHEGKVYILCIGQLIERKGIKYLIKAFSKIEKEFNNVVLLILGSGILEPNLKNLAKSLKIHNIQILTSGLRLEKLIMIYSIADIFVLPTLEDIWGFVINEAMACGLPVISTRASQAALEMIIPGENGYIIQERNAEELYVTLKNMIISQDERERMGNKSREIVTHRFSMSHMVEGFLFAINSVPKDLS